ncbi:hypothetical protein TPHA_0D02930 [Tetrapisispora phaffii CBS 4417]|uniref:Exoribonuclease phosphorolytic domain-containing protein n=1 Tax=Tetrapisispora phaffii (strain ATCC 24235 / CBS 4417 / NBRC 1672 / NRRL Y-8282 / UCD 70-5) TaxID=1071381 RepID=G8BSV8_TETPH|nr:hypothetical protein TPHA_0D02930 [Tetrapisispora phaffii CBS 4417]CCE62929.1 hypothetical protein TPHA_0D02930 [Tetrapisispora phaffii CBS 4417]
MSIEAVCGVLTHVDGSSQVEWNDTKVLCSVTGPIEPKARQELPSQLALEVIIRPAKGVSSTREKLMEDKLRSVLTPIITLYQYPRQLCQITCQILESGESEYEFSEKELSCCINAAFLALIDAGIALKSTVSSISLVISQNNEVIVNPTGAQLLNSRSVHILALELIKEMNIVNNVLLLDSNGDFNEKELFQVLETGEKSCLALGQDLRKVIQNNVDSNIIQ